MELAEVLPLIREYEHAALQLPEVVDRVGDGRRTLEAAKDGDARWRASGNLSRAEIRRDVFLGALEGLHRQILAMAGGRGPIDPIRP